MKKLTFSGHSGLFIETEQCVVAIDPWLDACPTCPTELKEPSRLDVVILTHGHFDHAGDAMRLSKKCGAEIIAAYELCALLQNDGVDENKLIGMGKGGTVKWKDIAVTLTNAFHSSSYICADGETRYAGEACGVVVQCGKQSLYHAGDTCLFSDMQLIAKQYRPNIAVLPIGDRFTMGPEEAAEAAALVGAPLTIPIHWGTFPLLTGTPEEFQTALKKRGLDTECVVLEPGASHAFS